MIQIETPDSRLFRRSRSRWAGILALTALPASLAACTGGDAAIGDGASVATTRQAVVGADCGYALSSDIHGVSKKGFHAKLKVTNETGPSGQSFAVFVNVGSAVIQDVSHGTFEAVQGGYILRPLASLENSLLDPGESYQFEVKLAGTYEKLEAYVVGANGVACDQQAPTVDLSVNSRLFTANGTLSLSAQATDNVALQKVVFELDGTVLAEDTSAPYALDVPVTAALDGRRRFTAKAFDISGNTASETERVLVAIESQFFGSAVTGAADYPRFLEYFDQVTPGNAGKWGSVEAVRDQMNWTELDAEYAFAQVNGLPFKFHTLVWGSQQPSWLATLSAEEQLAELDAWMGAVAERYPDLDLIDVVNEPMHAVPSYAAALGGAGTTGYDWMIKAFEMARSHFPNSELILNEYNVVVLPDFTQSFLPVVKLLTDRGLIDGIGEQGHFLERADVSVVASNLNALTATGLPIYVSELDLNLANDARQAQAMSALFPVFWEHPSVVGVTHWGYRQGDMWQPDAYLLRSDGSERPALTWLSCYLAGNSSCTVPPYVPQPRTGDATAIVLQAEDYDAAQGLVALGNIVAYTDDGDWLSFQKVAFNTNWNGLSVTYAKGSPGPSSLTLHLDSLSNPAVATVDLPSSGGWGTAKTVSVPLSPITGEHTVFARFNGGFGVANLDNLRIGAPPGSGTNIVPNGSFESNINGWFTWNGGSLSQSTRFHGGSKSLLVGSRASNAPAATDLLSVVKASTSYPVSVWVSIDSTDGTSKQINLTRALTCAGQSTTYAWVGNQVTVADDGQWMNIAGTLAIPNCTVTGLQLFVEGGIGADLYVDDLQVIDASTSNLLPDGSFEGGMGSWYGWSNTNLTVTNTVAHGGQQSLVSADRTANGTLARTVTSLLTPGKRYQGSFWVSVSGIAAGSASVNVTRKVICNDNTSYAWLGQANVSNGQWSQIAGSIDLSACTSVGEVTLYAEGPSSGNLYVDDVTLTLAP